MQRISLFFLLQLLSLLTFQTIDATPLYSAESIQKFCSKSGDAKLSSVLKARFNQRLQKLIGSQDAALLASPQGGVLLARHQQKALIPASTLKILTALIAIEKLGHKYRFATDFYLDHKKNLKVKGYGDPLLISESLSQIAQQLAQQNTYFNDIIIDDSYFQHSVKIPGKLNTLQPYDAPNGAMCVNFNTVAFKMVKGSFVSAEEQTPLLPSVLAKIKASGLKEGRIMLAGGQSESIRYAGELLQYFLTKAGIKVLGKVRRGEVEIDSDKLIFHHLSQFTLDQIISRLMEFSNNFIANQLFLSSGAAVLGEPATLAKGRDVADTYIRKNLGLSGITIVEGSGLSRQNRISAEAMLILLKEFEPHHQLMRHGNKEYYKTGTLNNVKARVGYLKDFDNCLYPFVVILNTPGKTTKGTMQLFRKFIAGKK